MHEDFTVGASFDTKNKILYIFATIDPTQTFFDSKFDPINCLMQISSSKYMRNQEIELRFKQSQSHQYNPQKTQVFIQSYITLQDILDLIENERIDYKSDFPLQYIINWDYQYLWLIIHCKTIIYFDKSIDQTITFVKSDVIRIQSEQPKTIIDDADYNQKNTIDANISIDHTFGTFKPQLIHGITQKSLNPLTLRQIYRVQPDKFRYTIPDSKLNNFVASFIRNSGRDYSQQQIDDYYYDIVLEEHFIQLSPSQNNDWASLVQYRHAKKPPHRFDSCRCQKYFPKADQNIAFMYTFGMESYNNLDDGSYLEIDQQNSKIVYVKDSNKQIINYLQFIALDKSGNIIENAIVEVVPLFSASKGSNWDVESNVQEYLDLFQNQHKSENETINQQLKGSLILVQFQVPLSIDFNLIFQYKSSSNQSLTINPIDYYNIQQQIKSRQQIFDQRFQQKFISQSDNDQFSVLQEISKTALSNLLGGLTWTYGPILIDQSNDYIQPKILFSATPSRITFLRGFLWDDGFHFQVICQWDMRLCLEMMTTWFGTQFSNGWIPREQIRGEESEHYANKRFLKQKPNDSNPPSLVLPIEMLLDSLKSNDLIIQTDVYSLKQQQQLTLKQYLKSFNSSLIHFHQWFQKAYQSQSNSLLFCWHTYDGFSFLDSGFDDYPRQWGKIVSQYQVDIQAWFIQFTKIIVQLNEEFGQYSLTQNYHTLLSQLVLSLQTTFINPENNLYVDVKIQESDYKVYSPHLGYISLFPLIFGLVEESSLAFNSTLDFIENSQLIWTEFGLRSLSRKDFFFGKDENYWRGPIWINVNYLVLRSLKKYYRSNQRAQRLFAELRNNIIRTVSKNYFLKGYFYENYDCQNGNGQYNHPFNGWTSLFVLIVNDIY